ncbi:hypothetical protein NM208_g10354 [Fusarium decemcellulare]|uniref:Uncharacterized protein n=1 Tax=Fusarium decemcellulare TaxID=57161 RepID=A0ACC1RYD2_9HYPO|nr:hypothetical protein NM208_g10354 [Fusarium decemcellulare]
MFENPLPGKPQLVNKVVGSLGARLLESEHVCTPSYPGLVNGVFRLIALMLVLTPSEFIRSFDRPGHFTKVRICIATALIYEDQMSKQNPVIVIVPGGFCSPKLYTKVADILKNDGFTVLVPPLAVCGNLPSKDPTSPEYKDLASKTPLDDVQQIHNLLIPYLDHGREAVVFAHSYGSTPGMLSVEGQTVEERAARGLKGGIKGFVTISGSAYPVRGCNVLGNTEETPIMPYHRLEEGVLHMQGDEAKPLFFSDLPPEAQTTAWANVFESQSRKSLNHKADFIEADIRIPKTYISCEKDECIIPAYQEIFIKSGGFERVEKLPSGHFPFLSIPQDTAKLLGRIATE